VTDTADLRALTEEDVKELGLKAVVDRRLRKHLRRLGNDSVREGSRLSSAAEPPQSPQEPPTAVKVEAIPENADKMNAPVQQMVFGDADVYFGGLEAIILPQMLQNSIEEECTLNDGGKWAEEYYYVTTMRSVETPIPEKNVVRDKGHQGFTLEQYCEMDAAKDANLNEADVVVLRLYTGPLFRPWNKALRDKEGLEQWATCIAVLYSAVIKLMKNAPPTTVYRGLDESNGWELPPAFLYPKKGEFAGGVELGSRDWASHRPQRTSTWRSATPEAKKTRALFWSWISTSQEEARTSSSFRSIQKRRSGFGPHVQA
jgi:hypothetical protein